MSCAVLALSWEKVFIMLSKTIHYLGSLGLAFCFIQYRFLFKEWMLPLNSSKIHILRKWPGRGGRALLFVYSTKIVPSHVTLLWPIYICITLSGKPGFLCVISLYSVRRREKLKIWQSQVCSSEVLKGKRMKQRTYPINNTVGAHLI